MAVVSSSQLLLDVHDELDESMEEADDTTLPLPMLGRRTWPR